MAKNVSRTGCVKKRDQVWNPRCKRWTKRKKETGRFTPHQSHSHFLFLRDIYSEAASPLVF